VTDLGTVLGGRYRLIELLGQGGMATIYRARDAQLERDVAVKVLRPEYGADPDFLDRFRNEAQSAASLNHPSVVAVYDYGTDPVGPFIVMELVEGEDLATIVRRSGALPPRAAARLVAQAARAIEAAHARGFVHRDIKPGNILVTRDGRVKVADFGIARAMAESALTLPGTTLGSVHYFSPEQARGEPATPASDIYSLGIVLFELLTGRRPWTGDTAAAIATARLTGAVPSPSAAHGGIPPTLEAITRKALATSPDERFASAADMADALDLFLGEERVGDSLRARGTGPGGAAAGAAGAAGAGALAAGAAAGAAAVAPGAATPAAADSPATVAGVARPNPGAQINYPREAFADGPAGSPGARGGVPAAGGYPDDDAEFDEARRTISPWVWVSGVLAVVILALAVFFVAQLVSGPGASPAPQVVVPSLLGKTYEEAKQAATDLGLTVEQVGFEETETALPGTVTRQDPAEGQTVDTGTSIKLTVAISPAQTVVPDLRLRTEAEAVALIQSAGLTVGTRTEDFDDLVPVDSVISQDPRAGLAVPRLTVVDYVVSTGPEPTPTPSPTPVPTPTPAPTPTPVPTPQMLTVHDYRCVPLALAEAEIQNDGFTLGSVSGPNDPASLVVAQDPAPETVKMAGSAINLMVVTLPAETCPA
jgi:eukaryotic-like serine/threonine-protein kinase